MKRKGITIWEQHVEHIVVGVAALFLVGFGAFQFISSPNTKSHGGREIHPGEIDELARQKARDLQGRLDASSGLNLDLPEHEPQRDAFAARLDAGVSPREQIAANRPGQRVLSLDVAPTELASYHVPTIPAPEPLAPAQFFDELQASVVEAIPVLADRFEREPYDLSWITASAVVDLDAIRAEFEASSSGESAIPPNWRDGRLDILDVVVERETMRKGAWGDRTVLDPLPDMLSFRERLAGEPSKSMRDDILGQLRRGGQSLVAQPPFYDTVANAFVPPSREDEALAESAAPTAEAAEIIRLRQRLRSYERQKEPMLRRLTEMGGSWTPGKQKKEDEKKKEQERQERETGGGGAGGGAGFGGAGGPGGGRRQQGEKRGAPGSGASGLGAGAGDPGASGFGGGLSGGMSEERKQEIIAGLQRQLDRLQERIDRVKASLEELTGVAQPESDEPVGPVDPLAGSEMVVWVHDITAEPGVSYRYRFTVQFYNPFFARKLDLLPEQHALADRLTMASATSQWSAPHRVLRPQKMFVVSAQATDGDIGLGTATVEVFRFYDGAWWERKFVVQPGERIGGMAEVDAAGDKVTIDFATEWYLLDVMPDLDAPGDRDARVLALVQRIEGGSPESFDPMLASADPERSDLRDRVQEAEAARTEKPEQAG